MKHLILLMMLLASVIFAHSQQKPVLYIYDKDWKPVKNPAAAHYVVQETNVGDSFFISRIFKGGGYLWRQESYKDADLTIPHGQFAWYDDQGKLDSAGWVTNRIKDSWWTYYDDTLGITLSIKYNKGREELRRDYINKIITTPQGIKTFDQEKAERDSLLQVNGKKATDEKEAVFKGGAAAYRKYLEKTLDPPTNLTQTGTVKVQFFINKMGMVENLMIMQSVQLSADLEALRVLSNMPAWTPAYQNGKNVTYQCIQHIPSRLCNA